MLGRIIGLMLSLALIVAGSLSLSVSSLKFMVGQGNSITIAATLGGLALMVIGSILLVKWEKVNGDD